MYGFYWLFNLILSKIIIIINNNKNMDTIETLPSGHPPGARELDVYITFHPSNDPTGRDGNPAPPSVQSPRDSAKRLLRSVSGRDWRRPGEAGPPRPGGSLRPALAWRAAGAPCCGARCWLRRLQTRKRTCERVTVPSAAAPSIYPRERVTWRRPAADPHIQPDVATPAPRPP